MPKVLSPDGRTIPLMPDDTGGAQLGARAVGGGLWALGAQGTSAAATLIGVALFAALLEPRDFGLVAIATVTLEAATSGLSFGIGQIVQAIGADEDVDRTALSLALVVGAATGLALWFAAPWLSSFLSTESATPFVRALAPIILVRRWSEARRGMLDRDLRFRYTSVAQGVGAVSGLVIGVAVALTGGGAWALIAQLVVSEFVFATLLSTGGSGTRLPGYDAGAVRKIWTFAKEFIGNAVVVFAYNNLDDAAVARIAGAANLGFYSVAYRIANGPTYLFSRTAGRILLPAFVRLRNTGRQWGDPYLGAVAVLSGVTGPIMFGLLIHGPAILETAYGGRWSASYLPLRVLALYGLFRAVGATTGTVFIADGDPGLVRRIAQWQTLGMLVAIVPAVSFWGIAGAAVAVTAPLMVASVYALLRTADVVGVRPAQLFLRIGTLWSVSALCNLAVLPIRSLLPGWLGLLTAGTIAVFLLAATLRLVLRREIRKLQSYTNT